MTEQENRQYFNDPQMYSLLMNTRDEVIVARAWRGQRGDTSRTDAVLLSGDAW